MKKIFYILAVAALTAASCAEKAEGDNASSKLADATDLVAEQTDLTTVRLTWTDNARGETGYRVFLRKEGDSYYVQPLDQIAADSKSYTFTDLTPGKVYDFGVQALSEDMKLHSEIVYCNDFKVVDYEKMPQLAEVVSTYAYLAVSYSYDSAKISGTNPEHGLCFSAEGVPTVNDIKVAGPDFPSGKTSLTHIVPNAVLDADKEYQACVYIKDGDEYVYSAPQKVELAAQPAEIALTWEKQTYESLPAEVEVYRTTSSLNGRAFNAWYAVADPADVDFRVLNTPTGKANLKTLEKQAEGAEDCYVLINGGVFGNYHIGVIFVDGKPQEWVDNVYNNYWSPAGDGKLFNITRPIIGVDADGKAGAYWTASPKYGTYYYYTRPMATVVGEATYGEASETVPAKAVSWNPYNALSTGPMLLYDGKCCINHEKNKAGNYYTNYECWALDIYEGRPDRTAVGVTADGKIVLFICDGRIDASQGATHEEVAMIMKNIGCVHAMNLDGGGSTGMWVKDASYINDQAAGKRAIKSTLGFFKK